MGSETIKIYIPVENSNEKVVDEFINLCINCMDSLTIDSVTKYTKDKANKVIVNRCERITCYGRVQLYKDIIRQAAIKMAIALGIYYLHIEINDTDEAITSRDIEFYVKLKEVGENQCS